MNFYAFIPLVSFLITMCTWTYVYAQRRHTPVNRAYLTFAAVVALWMLELFLLWSPSPENLLLPLEKITTTTGFLAVFSLLNFTFVFLERKKSFLYYVLSFFFLCSAVLNIFTNYYVDGYVRYSWGVSLRPGRLFFPMVFGVYVLPVFWSLTLLYAKMKEVENENTKKQLSLLLQGTCAFFLLSLVSDVIIPHVFGFTNVVRLGIPGGAVQSLFIFMAVRKYNFLGISFEEVSHALFTNLRDGIILLDANGYVLLINDYAKTLLHIDTEKARQIRMSRLFTDYSSTEAYKDHEVFLSVDGEAKIFSLSQADVKQYPLAVGKILIIRDITEETKAQRVLYEHKKSLEKLAHGLAEANASLEQKVAKRTVSLQRSNSELHREISERQHFEEALAAETERLTVTLHSIGDGVITTDTAGTTILLNRVAEELTGWRQEQAIGKPLSEILQLTDEKTRQPCRDMVEEVLCTEGCVGHGRHALLHTQDGTERIIAENGALIRDREGNVLGVVLVLRDITAQRKMEADLFKADKLESIGLLAGGIAHDFNNLLMAINGNIVLAQCGIPREHEAFQHLREAEQAGLRAQQLTQQLLTFAKGGAPIKKLVSLADLVRESVAFALRGSSVRATLALPDYLWPAHVDTGQITQVLNNLVINAKQAIPAGGVLEIQANNVDITAHNAEQFGLLPPGPYVEIGVKDHGIGIPQDHLSKIFDPYFTTKEKGSGLGLFTAYSIIKKHEGHMSVASEVGMGTTFFLYLPATEAHLAVDTDRQDACPSGTGKILVMDDDEIIRALTGAMLQRVGYDVAFAEHGAQALDLYQTAHVTGQPFAAVIMDLTIPGGMGGKETIGQLLALDPQAKAIVVSGYSQDPILADCRRYGFYACLAKPYRLHELAQVLHDVVGGQERKGDRVGVSRSNGAKNVDSLQVTV